jgi:hypothetical protein
MPKSAANGTSRHDDDEEANAPTEVRAVPSIARKDSRSLTEQELAEAASFADQVVQSVTAPRRGSRPASGVVPKNKGQPVQVPPAPRMPTLAGPASEQKQLIVYAIVLGIIVGALAWLAFRYL